MSVKYEDLRPIDFIGGEHEKDDDDDFLLSQCQHVVADNGNYIVSMFLKRIPRVLNNNGQHVTDIGAMGYRNDQFNMSAGMTFHNDKILITDVNQGKILIYKKKNFNFVRAIRNNFEKPNCIVSISDMLYVGDMGTNSIHVLDKHYTDCFVIYKAGEKRIQGTDFISCDHINKRVLLTDREAESVHIFSLDGTYQLSISEHLTSPCGTTTDRHGNILVCNMADGVSVFDRYGNYISRFGRKYSFTSPVDVCTKGNGSEGKHEVVVLDGSIYSAWSRLQIFRY